jgi:PAS domain S-box-containing protein
LTVHAGDSPEILLAARPPRPRNRAGISSKLASQYARSLIEASRDPLVTIGLEGKITEVNEATIQMTGVARGDLAGTDFSDRFTEPDLAREGYLQVLGQGFVTDYPLTIRHTGGELTEVLYSASVYRDVGGQALGVFAAVRDVTASRRLVQELAETKSLLNSILQSSAKYSIIGEDLKHRIVFWNEGAHRNYGYTAEEVIGRDSSILHAPHDVESGAVDHLLAAAYADGTAEGTFERVRKDGSRFTVTAVVTRRDDTLGRPIGFLLMSEDISEQKLAEDQLRSASDEATKQRARELDRLAELERFQQLTVGRELRMIELKNEIEHLRAAAGCALPDTADGT